MLADSKGEVIDGQLDFSGGMNMISPVLADNEYRYAENFSVRNGVLQTRGGMRRAFPILTWWWNEQFYFNEENAKYMDGSHTGFWFPFDFGHTPNIQGVTYFRFPADETYRQIIVEGGKIYVYDRGAFGELSAEDPMLTTDECVFITANNWLVMLRGQDRPPLRWDGNSTEFTLFTDSGATNRIPEGYVGAYVGGRLIVADNRSDLGCSDIFDIDNYDEVYQQFSIAKGDGDSIVQLVEFSGDHLLIFKERSVYVMSGLTYAGTQGAFTGKLADYIGVENVFNDVGMVGKNAYAVHGENVTWLSHKGIQSLRRSSEGKVLGMDVTLSEPIKPLIDRINWTYASKCCATFFNNYLLFAVPLGTSKVNDHILVYDLQAGGGRGAWVSVWKSQVAEPIEFFTDEEKLFFIGEDGGVRQMFTDDPRDSETPHFDTKLYQNTKLYFKDDLVKWTEDGTKYYKALLEHTDKALTDAQYWEEQTDVQHLYDTQSVVWTRFFRHKDLASPKKFSRCQVLYKHQNPKLSIDIEDENYLSLANIFTDITQNRLAYDVDNRADWVGDNSNDDWATTGRQDYTLRIPEDSFFIPAFGGTFLNVYEYHDLRFIPKVANNTAFGLRITNKQGKIEIRSILNKAKYSAFARRNI